MTEPGNTGERPSKPRQGPSRHRDWRSALRRYIAFLALANLVWELAHVPLYTIWVTGTPTEILFAVLHCTGGDILIGTSALLAALLVTAPTDWPASASQRTVTLTLVLGLGYTVFSEWLNVEVRGAWAYRDVMPVLPILGTGLSPLLQWIVIPLIGFRWATRPEKNNLS